MAQRVQTAADRRECRRRVSGPQQGMPGCRAQGAERAWPVRCERHARAKQDAGVLGKEGGERSQAVS